MDKKLQDSSVLNVSNSQNNNVTNITNNQYENNKNEKKQDEIKEYVNQSHETSFLNDVRITDVPTMNTDGLDQIYINNCFKSRYGK